MSWHETLVDVTTQVTFPLTRICWKQAKNSPKHRICSGVDISCDLSAWHQHQTDLCANWMIKVLSANSGAAHVNLMTCWIFEGTLYSTSVFSPSLKQHGRWNNPLSSLPPVCRCFISLHPAHGVLFSVTARPLFRINSISFPWETKTTPFLGTGCVGDVPGRYVAVVHVGGHHHSSSSPVALEKRQEEAR